MTDNPLVEAVALAAWLEYQGLPLKRPEPEYDGDDIPDRWDWAVRDWKEWPTGCTHIGADGFRRCATAALRAIKDAGWKLVPVEATPDMENAAYEVQVKGADLHDFTAHDCAKDIWAAMISAAPKG